MKCLRLPQRLRSSCAIVVSKLKSRSQHTESTEEIGARIASTSRRSQTESALSCRGIVQDRRQETFVLPLAILTARSLLRRPPGRPIRHICLTALSDFAPFQILFYSAHVREGAVKYFRAEKSLIACPLVYCTHNTIFPSRALTTCKQYPEAWRSQHHHAWPITFCGLPNVVLIWSRREAFSLPLASLDAFPSPCKYTYCTVSFASDKHSVSPRSTFCHYDY